jgi:hypothetical protein
MSKSKPVKDASKSTPRATAHKGGRKTKLQADERTLSILQGLARIQCTQKEGAAVLGVHEGTFSAFLKANEQARDAWELGREAGKVSLRRMQWAAAEKSPQMLIWLGKQYLDQRDKLEQAVDAVVENVSRADVENAARDLDGRLATLFSRPSRDDAVH